MAAAQQNSDIQIPPPVQQQPPAANTPVQAPEAAPAQTDNGASTSGTSVGDISPAQFNPAGLTGNEIIIGVVISLILAALFWFVGRTVTDTLIKQFTEVSAAKRAGTTLFAFLSVLGAFATFGFLGNFWLAAFFFIPAALLSVLMLFVFLFSFVAANRSKRL